MDKRLLIAIILFVVFGSIYFLFPSGTDSNEIKGEVTISGNYESVYGVMDPLSCYCGNSGYLTTIEDKRIPVCFQDYEEEISCINIKVKGIYQSKEINPHSTSPCPSGTRTLLYVSSYECK